MKAQCSLLFLGFLFISVESQSNPTPLNHSLKVEKARALSLCLRSIPFEIASETTNSAFTITTNNVQCTFLQFYQFIFLYSIYNLSFIEGSVVKQHFEHSSQRGHSTPIRLKSVALKK